MNGLNENKSVGDRVPLEAELGQVFNLSEPIRIQGLHINGISAETARVGQKTKIWTRLSLTSDDRHFHRIMEGLNGLLSNALAGAGQPQNLERANNIIVVIHEDACADIWIDTAAISVQIIPRRQLAAGSVVFEHDIADVTGMNFPAIEIGSRDKVICIFREEWRFGLFCDFNPDQNFSREIMVSNLGVLYRKLKYSHIYNIMADSLAFKALFKAGWFPFIQIIGAEFRNLVLLVESGLPLNDAEAAILGNFDKIRFDRMLEHWLTKPSFAKREAILRSAFASFQSGNYIATIKTILTEIEGILQDAYIQAEGKAAKLSTLLEFATNSAVQKAGGENTLLLPLNFAEYLKMQTFANFNPLAPDINASSRHAVGHGAASEDSYTPVRALQALLTIDQFSLYL